MSEPAEDLHSFDSQPNAQVVDPDSDRTRSEFLDSWAQHLSAGQPADLPSVDASTGTQRVFLAHDIKDLQEYGTGICIGLQNTALGTLQALSQCNSVNNLLRHTGQQFTQAVDYYSKQPGRLFPDTRTTLNAIGQSAVTKFGHPLSPRLAGEYTGQALTFFLPMSAGGKVLSEEEMAAYGGEGALKAMPKEELTALKLTRIEPDECGLATAAKIVDLQLDPEIIDGAVQSFEKIGEVSSEGLEQVGRYLRLFEDPHHPGKLLPYNQAMLTRLIKGERSAQDLCFYRHELVESSYVAGGMEQSEAHLKTLRYQGLEEGPTSDTALYHPSVLMEYTSYFSSPGRQKILGEL